MTKTIDNLYARAESLNVMLYPSAFTYGIVRQNNVIYFSPTVDIDKFCSEMPKLLNQIEIEKTRLGKTIYG